MENEVPKDECFQIEIPYNVFQYLSSDDCNIESLCRICLSENNKELFPLISEAEGGLLQEMFTAFTAIQVVPQDGLPSQVCDLCRNQITNCYEFKMQCMKADFTLKSLLKGVFTKTENLEPKNQNLKADNFKKETSVCDQLVSGAISVENNAVNKFVKDEDDIAEDIQYLEDLSGSDNEALCIVQNAVKIKREIKEESTTDVKPLKSAIRKKAKKKKKKPHLCSLCSKKFSSRKALQDHVSRAHTSAADADAQVHKCDTCAQTYHSEHDLSLHAPVHGPGPVWGCVQCRKEFKGRSMFRRHIKRHMDTKQYSCDVCGKPFAELYALKRHSGVHTGARVEKKYACTQCDKRYSDSGLLAAHLSRHLGVRPCVCSECGKAFSSARLLASHRRVHADLKPYHCPHCDKRFRHESTRNTHARTHTGERPYVCAACGKRFIQSSNLTLHMRTHTGERPYKCSTCSASFSSGSTLKAHTRRHTGDKPYSCHQCGKRFARADLRTHMLGHSGERPYACALCARRFVTAARLRDHSRVHTGERPFECSTCSQKFGSKTHLVKHMKKHQIKIKPCFLLKNSSMSGQCHEEKKNQAEHLSPAELIDDTKNLIIDVTQDDTNVTGEIIITNEMLEPEAANVPSNALCLSSRDVTYPDMNLVTVDGSEVRIAASALEGATLKLYQLDQSMVQIHSSGGQVTISKITSKMTANF